MQSHSRIKVLVLFISLSILSISLCWSATPKIKIKINGLADTTIILAHYLNKSIYPDDTVKLNSTGQATFSRTL